MFKQIQKVKFLLLQLGLDLCIRKMDDSTKRLLQRIIKRIPFEMLETTLEKWERLTEAQRNSLDFTRSKWALTERLLAICEVCCNSSLQNEYVELCNVCLSGYLFVNSTFT